MVAARSDAALPTSERLRYAPLGPDDLRAFHGLRRLPGVLRSDSPHAFAAVGPRAAEITLPHPVDVPHGPDSPPGRVHALDGQVLLLGVGHDSNTSVHLAELLAGVRYHRAAHSTILRDGRPTR